MTIFTKNKETQVFLIQTALEFLNDSFKTVSKITWVNYRSNIPEFIYDTLAQKLLYYSTQMRLECISDRTWINVWKLRKMLKDYTISELERCKLRQWKVIIWECIDDKNNFTYHE